MTAPTQETHETRELGEPGETREPSETRGPGEPRETRETLRCFLAAPLSTEALRALVELQRALHERAEKAGVKLRWVPPENLHLTLKFFGDIPRATVPAIERDVTRIVANEPPITLDIVGIGAFPSLAKARVLWAGLREDTPRIAQIQRRVEDAMETLGFPREEHAYAPHLTLARSQRHDEADLREVAAQHAYAPIGRTTARELVLIDSALHPRGARYSVLAKSPLLHE